LLLETNSLIITAYNIFCKFTNGPVDIMTFLPSDYYYLYFFVASSALAGIFGLFRGKGPSSPGFLALVRLALFSIYWYPMYRFHATSSFLWLLYLPSYMDQSELSGARVNEWFRGCIVPRTLHKFFQCSLVTTPTCKLLASQYIFAMHPHGLLPVGAVLSVCTKLSGFEDKFPNLKKRVIAAATLVDLSPIFRDICLAAGVVDCARYSFESFLRRGYTVGVFVGGAIEGLYAHPEGEEVLDLLRKRGFIRLAMIHNIPVVPCYTFNEVNHIYQVKEDVLKKFWLVSIFRRLFNRISGLICPFISSFVRGGDSVVTVMGAPISFHTKVPRGGEPSEDELDRAMQQYVNILTKLYNDHGPKYNIQKERRLRII
jgi:2-acylglycerol O-acyltransferase 2